ncbi:MAG: hypothetical protein JSS66_14645 [Armatimonadetes bacterium]|nr:hypothetical protein [Armatimonadota bacterium]
MIDANWSNMLEPTKSAVLEQVEEESAAQVVSLGWRGAYCRAKVEAMATVLSAKRDAAFIANIMAIEACQVAGKGSGRTELILACRIVATERAIHRFEKAYYAPIDYDPVTLTFMERRIDLLNRRLGQFVVSLEKVKRIRRSPALINIAQHQEVHFELGPERERKAQDAVP